jgi:hypothetical protein
MRPLRIKEEPIEPPAYIDVRETQGGYQMTLNIEGINALSNTLSLLQDTGNYRGICRFQVAGSPRTLEVFIKTGA